MGVMEIRNGGQQVNEGGQQVNDGGQQVNNGGQHLTDEQFAELLLGAKGAQVHEHLRACGECAEEAERVAGAIGSFEQQSRLWAERRAAMLPAVTAERALAPAWTRMPGVLLVRPQTWAAAAVVAAIAVGVSVSVSRQQQRAPEQTVATISAQQPAAQQPAAQAPAAVEQPDVQADQQTAFVTTGPDVRAMAKQSKLKADNELLAAIDGELRADESASTGLYGLSVGSHLDRVRDSGRMAN